MTLLIKHPFGVTKFKKNIGKFKLIDVFPNYGNFNGAKDAKNLAKQIKVDFKYIRVVHKINASAVYAYKLRKH